MYADTSVEFVLMGALAIIQAKDAGVESDAGVKSSNRFEIYFRGRMGKT